MPELCRFDGISIHMYCEPNERHNSPHLHAYYQDDEAAVSIDGVILEGDLPYKKMKLLLVWIDIHKDELEKNWRLLLAGEAHFKIKPLR